MITIGDLSRRTEVNIETIRYYERIGLMPVPGRTDSGRRRYGTPDVQRLAFIRHGRELGFDITTIRTMLGFKEMPDASCEQVSLIARDQLGAVQDRIARLQRLKDELERMIGACNNGKVSECRIIEVLAEHGAHNKAATWPVGLLPE